MKMRKNLLISLFLLGLAIEKLQANTWLDNLMLQNYPSYPCSCSRCDCSPYWVDAEYLYWQIKSSPRIPPLVFTGIFDKNVTPTIQTAGTTTVLGNKSIPHKGHSGMKIAAGYCFGGPRMWGMELNYTFLEKISHSKSVQSNDFVEDGKSISTFPDNSYLAIPFFDVTTGQNSSAYITKPDTFSGKATLRTSNWMQGAEWNFTAIPNITICSCNFEVQALGGFRYWNYNERLEFTTSSPSTTNPDVFRTKDKFNTENSFYGAQIGFSTKYTYRSLSCTFKAKIALGAMDERLDIRGKLQTNDFDNFGTVQTFLGGYYALSTNIGHYGQWKFAYVPEINLNFGYKVSRCVSINFGYTFLYVSKIFWAENQINQKINTTQAPAITRQAPTGLTGVPSPKAPLKSKDFWVQGLNVGIDFIF